MKWFRDYYDAHFLLPRQKQINIYNNLVLGAQRALDSGEITLKQHQAVFACVKNPQRKSAK